MRDIFVNLHDNYKKLKSQIFNKEHPMYEYMVNKVPNILVEYLGCDTSKYKIEGTVGKGSFSQNPWIGIFNKEITNTAQKGVYIAYLFSTDCEDKVYLTLNQGVSGYRIYKKTSEVIELLKNTANLCYEKLNSFDFINNNLFTIGTSPTSKKIVQGVIYYKEYNLNSLPEEAELKVDLDKMLDIYNQYFEKIFREQK